LSDQILTVLERISRVLWGPYVLIPLLVATGVWLTFLLRGIQFRKLGYALWLGFVVRKDDEGSGDISQFQSLMTALAATVGTGNIVGVATAIALGGPGALFWLWVMGLIGMATKYAEAVLAVKYRVTDARGEAAGGAMYYLSLGLRHRRVGRVLSVLFAFFTACAAFGIGNMVQANSIALALEQSFGVSPLVTGIVLTIVAGAIVLGGVKSVGRVSGVVVPVMILVYVLTVLAIIVLNASQVPHAIAVVIDGAFTRTAPVGGFVGASVAQAMRYGLARGIFSNEAGMGSGGIASAAAQTTEPVRQALVAMTQTFIDTVVVCGATGIAIIITGAWQSGLQGVAMTQSAFSSGLSGLVSVEHAFSSALGPFGSLVVTFSLCLFAFSTIIGWGYYGERGVEYLFGARAVLPYRVIYLLTTVIGATAQLALVWTFADVMNGLMALPNLVGLLALSTVVVAETRSYFGRHPGKGRTLRHAEKHGLTSD
jgi:AGCS family alanine or glycine:cation symporter